MFSSNRGQNGSSVEGNVRKVTTLVSLLDTRHSINR